MHHVDYLTFTYRPSIREHGEGPRAFLRHALQTVQAIQPDIEADWDTWGDKGHHGFTFSGRLLRHGQPVGFVAAGGGGHGRAYVELTGAGLAGVSPKQWRAVADWLQHELHARLSRVDACIDDHAGKRTVHDVRAAYLAGEFDKRGQRPSHKMLGPWDCPERWGDGLSYYIGKRENGLMLRAYEKGRQLGDPDSPWTRFEVEFRRTTKKEITFDVLRDPLNAMASAYDWLVWVPSQRSPMRVHSHQVAGAIALKSLMRYARLSYGKLLAFLQAREQWCSPRLRG